MRVFYFCKKKLQKDLLDLIFLPYLAIFIYEYNRLNNTLMARTFRELTDETKAKISQSMRGRSKSFTHREHISDALRKYWETIPNKQQNRDNEQNTRI